MVLLNHVVEVFDLKGLDQPEPFLPQQHPVDVLQSRQIRTASVDDNLLRPIIVLDLAGRISANRLIPVNLTSPFRLNDTG